jgi:nitrous oxidase accessory protein
MYVQSSPGNVMKGNDVSRLRYGLHFMSSDRNRFELNVFHDNVAGAAIMYSEGIELRRNAFIHNRGFSSFGILFQDCRKCVTESNLIADNATGVFLEALRDSVFTGNTISENDVAAQVFGSSENNVFARNNFVDNISPLLMIGRSRTTAWSSAEGGNYWSDYAGYDTDGDGVGDVPHRIQNVFEYLESSFPRLRLYLNSPSAQSMVAAERSLPIIQGSGQFDPRPLMYPVATDVDVILPDRRRTDLGLLAASVFMLAASATIFRMGEGR